MEELLGAIGNREMGRLIENHQNHPTSPFPKLQGELPLLGDVMPVSQGTIQRQPLFRGLSQELTVDTAMALPATEAVIQPKLTLGTPGDMYEEEADRVARQVVDEIHSSPFREPNTQSPGERKPEVGEAGRVQRQITVRGLGDAGGELSSEWEGELQRAKSGGQPLSPKLKEPIERAFGADFGGVRVHTGAQADRLARSIQAKAFTTGQDVFFRQGAYQPGSRGGQELIAHELTHVVQQNRDTAIRRVTESPIVRRAVIQRWKELLKRVGYITVIGGAANQFYKYRMRQLESLSRTQIGQRPRLYNMTRPYQSDQWGYGVNTVTALLYVTFRDRMSGRIADFFAQPYVLELLASRSPEAGQQLAEAEYAYWRNLYETSKEGSEDHYAGWLGMQFSAKSRYHIMNLFREASENSN